MTCGIYLIRNVVSGDTYIGRSVSIERRWEQYQFHLPRTDSIHVNIRLKRLCQQTGINAFCLEVLEVVEDQALLPVKEKAWIARLSPTLNVFDGCDMQHRNIGLAALRKSAGLTVDRVARIMDLTSQHVRRWERVGMGIDSPSQSSSQRKRILKLISLYEVSMDELRAANTETIQHHLSRTKPKKHQFA